MKIFQVDENTWYAADTMDEAKRQAKKDYELPIAEIIDGSEHELTDEEMDGKIYYDDTYNSETSERRTFREQLSKLMKAGWDFPCMFAFSEY